jgi:beta-galactosidase
MGTSTKLEKFHYGVCYYPEAWHPSRHKSDIDRIAASGFNFVRMGEGAWSYWEPTEGNFQFAQFDRVINYCRSRNVKVILGTPTYACPAWVSSNYPEVLRWNFERIPMKHGSRRNLNYTSPKMLDLSDRLCMALADHYKNEVQIVGWQLDNEFNCHMDVSYAPSDTVAFRQWCQEHYRTLDALNDSWGTKFWSQTYTAWGQIDLPHPTAACQNPSVQMDESRFISDTVVRFARRQKELLRARNPNWFITHNALFANVDGPALTAELDFFSHDQYPLFFPNWFSQAEMLVQARSLSFPYGLLEQQAGPGGQMGYLHRTPRAGEMRLWAWQSILHGAKLLSFFRWRTCPYGSEQHWHGLLDADDKDNRRLAEAKVLGEELTHLPSAFFDAPPIKAVAVLRDYDNEINDRRINTYIGGDRNEWKRWIYELMRQHVPVDEAWPGSDFGGYRLLIAPHLKMMDEALVAKLTAFVKAGGTLILGAQSGLKDRNVHVVERTPPGLLAELAGVEVEDWSLLPEKETRSGVLENGEKIELTRFVERLRLTRAKAIAQWDADDTLLAGSPSAAIHALGKGEVVYLGGYCPDAAVKTVSDWLIARLNIKREIEASADVEAIVREGSGKRYFCLLNHSGVTQQVSGLPKGTDLLSGETVSSGKLELGALAVRVVQA